VRHISRPIWSHDSIETSETYQVNEVRKSESLYVKSFPELVEIIAKISYRNKYLNLFYRGQSDDYLNIQKETTIMPSMYRGLPKGKEAEEVIAGKFIKLKQADEYLRNKIGKKDVDLDSTFLKFPEVRWAIFQHYEVCQTPLLDITTSLRAACSFALHNNKEAGYVYVLGLPHINGSISYYVDESLVNIKLLSICPPHALRPHYQEGYLAGSFPIEYTARFYGFMDFGRRLVAKFRINKKGFWKRYFHEIPQKALYPEGDTFQEVCENIKLKL